MKKLDITTKFKEIKKQYHMKDIRQAIKKKDISMVLPKVGLKKEKYINCVWAMLDNELENIYSDKFKFNEGASVAHIGAYLAILLGDGDIKTDREEIRDYVIKPLMEVGAIESVTFLNKGKKYKNIKESNFYNGHLIPKSPNLCYRLSNSFIELIRSSSSDQFESIFNDWIKEESKNERLSIIAKAESMNKSKYIEDGHGHLIKLSIELYGESYLEGYKVVYTDALDGDRITKEEKIKLDKNGIKFGDKDDVWPDVILYNPDEEKLWFIEAVTSDGEVDNHKLQGLRNIANKSNKIFGGATTTYLDYITFGKRQEVNKNLAIGSYVWIYSSPDKLIEIK